MNTMVGEKACSRCSEIKPLNEYYRDGNSHRSECKKCSKLADRNKYILNREYVLARQSEYYQNNANRIKTYVKEWQKVNSEKCKEYHKNYAEKNFNSERERHRLKNMRDRTANPKKYADQNRRWAQNNPEKVRAKSHRRRARKHKNGEFLILDKEYRRLYASLCVICGLQKKITADHIIPLALGGTHSIGNLQPLCLSCNSSKGVRLMIQVKKKISDASLGEHGEFVSPAVDIPAPVE